VEQKGSVSPNHLRFDFPHFAKVTDEELHQVDFVNARIQEQLPIERRDIPLHTGGRRRCYGFVCEKYGDHVRAIKFERAWSFVEEFT
jgi:alanyl-tRNA synthetase